MDVSCRAGYDVPQALWAVRNSRRISLPINPRDQVLGSMRLLSFNYTYICGSDRFYSSG